MACFPFFMRPSYQIYRKVPNSVHLPYKQYNMKQAGLAHLFYREVEKIVQQTAVEEQERVQGLYQLMNLLFIEVTRKENIQFTTLFARIAYVSHRHQFPSKLIYFLHRFRSKVRSLQSTRTPEVELVAIRHLGTKALIETIHILFNSTPPTSTIALIPSEVTFTFKPVDIQSFKANARVVALADDSEQAQLIIQDEQFPSRELRMQYNIADRNENFNTSIDQIRSSFGFPVNLNLLDIEIDKAGIYRPKAWVIEPDFLIDVTAVAECFKDFGAAPLLYLLKKYLPFETTKYLMIGHIANFFLDELMTNPQATFKETFPKVFALNPLAFANFENSIVREIMQTSQRHFLNLKRIIQQDLPQNGIPIAECFLEPSFYSEQYGLQGRLDVFYPNPDAGQQSAIVELKSGKPFRPNAYGISHNHFTQTLLYDLLIKSAYKNDLSPANYILYSGIELNQLKFAPVVKAQQMEAIQVRNQLVSIERNLTSLLQNGLDQPNIFDLLHPRTMGAAKGFVQRDLAIFEKVYTNMRPIDRKYFIAFSSFIAREHQLAKTGIQGLDQVNGLASLWLNDFVDKQENFEVISYLKIKENRSKAVDPILIFDKTEQTNELANFRKGDIAVLYPFRHTADTVLNNQLFKCTIIDINKKQVQIRLRSPQFNDSIFQADSFWNIEHDLLDSSFISMYRGLFQFAQASLAKKQLLLGEIPPASCAPEPVQLPHELTIEQKDIFQQMLASKDYFLLWGPPGTGKTSLMLKYLVAHLLNHTDEQILLLAYTNRAVDEICEAIESIDQYAKEEYIRIGSRYSTDQRFRNRLLDSRLSSVSSRQELKKLIERHRIFVGTVASVVSKQDLLQLKSFNRVIIDEASQILEPLLVGLLPLFEHVILIGDHQQLPAVVVQEEQYTNVYDADLQAIGLSKLSNSLFERLYNRAQQQGWDWAYARLSHQGRMHEDIMKFPSQYFYQNALHILPAHLPNSTKQTQVLDYQLPEQATALEQLLAQQRVLFLPCSIDNNSTSRKTNVHEAAMICQLVKGFQRIYAANDLAFHPNTLGIITPIGLK